MSNTFYGPLAVVFVFICISLGLITIQQDEELQDLKQRLAASRYTLGLSEAVIRAQARNREMFEVYEPLPIK